MKKTNIVIAILTLIAIQGVSSASEKLHPRAIALKAAVNELSKRQNQTAWSRANDQHNDPRASDSPGGDTPRMQAQRKISNTLDRHADGAMDIPNFLRSQMNEEIPQIISNSAGQGSIAKAWAQHKEKSPEKTIDYLEKTNSIACVGPGCIVGSRKVDTKSYIGKYAGDVRLPQIHVAGPIELKMDGEPVTNSMIMIEPGKAVVLSRDELTAVAKSIKITPRLEKKIEDWSNEIFEQEATAKEISKINTEEKLKAEQEQLKKDALGFFSN